MLSESVEIGDRNVELQEARVMVKKSVVFFCAVVLAMATAAYAQTDAVVTANVKSRIAADDLVKSVELNVTTEDHVVTLTGTVPTKAAKDRVLSIARATSGVTSVVDKVTVRTASAAADKTAAEKAAGGVEKGVDKSADAVGTAAHSTAKAVDKSKEKTGAAVGTAAKATGNAIGTAAQKTAAAIGVAGDKTKEATAKAGEKTKEATANADKKAGTTGEVLSDAAITSAVKAKLLGDGTTPGLKVDVDTEDGVVTLHGNLATAAQRATALRLARETKGVTRVVDKLTVAGK
jgi:osmotically-inducible protein OsmY